MKRFKPFFEVEADSLQQVKKILKREKLSLHYNNKTASDSWKTDNDFWLLL